MLGLLIKSLLFERSSPFDRCQEEAQVAVVLQTVLGPSVEHAICVRAGFGRADPSSDRCRQSTGQFREYRSTHRILSPNIGVTRFDPGYSTSIRHGGVHTIHFGGALRTILSFAANGRCVAYLDDDDWYAEDHLSSLFRAIQGNQWAFSQRWFVIPFNLEPMCIDTIENLGPAARLYASYGGFACPSSLMIDKKACAPILHVWSEAFRPDGDEPRAAGAPGDSLGSSVTS